MSGPALIAVCGAPASGKTTLARRLVIDLRLPLLEKDVIKESLLYALALAMVERGVDVMIEANLTRPYADAALARLAEHANLLICQCEADASVIETRYRERARRGERHAAHFDLDALPDLLTGLEDGRYDLTGLGYEVLMVHTDDGYRPGYGAIREAIRRHVRG